MKKRKFHIRLLLLLVLLVSLTGFAVGKYFRTLPSHSSQVTFTAKLADSFVLRESKAEKQSDGTYKLSDTEYKTDADKPYALIPGVYIPKNPHVIITGKSEIPAYLFIEVVDATPNNALVFSLTEKWIATTLKAPQHGGTVYVYSTDGSSPAQITSDLTVYILKGNIVEVRQTLLSGNKDNQLVFYAYLEEAVAANP